jgi:hypothetical protein
MQNLCKQKKSRRKQQTAESEKKDKNKRPKKKFRPKINKNIKLQITAPDMDYM